MDRETSISVRHNMEMAHRLFLTPGKCENIHGHSWWVTMHLFGQVNHVGLLLGIDYGDLKKVFRHYLDATFDHHILLNKDDPWSGPLVHSFDHDLVSATPSTGTLASLPGLQVFDGDPTTENVARTIGEHMVREILEVAPITGIKVDVWETSVNNATWQLNNIS